MLVIGIFLAVQVDVIEDHANDARSHIGGMRLSAPCQFPSRHSAFDDQDYTFHQRGKDATVRDAQ